MGVNGLWPILSELCEKKPLTYLAGKKVAVDLSGWVVAAMYTKGLNTSKNPHLRNLFFRASHLLQLGVYPIFVTEGELPAIKEATVKKRHCGQSIETSNSNVSRSQFDETLKGCEDLLKCLGVPCVKSSGEAEAFCAFLCLKGVVSGVITEDNDAFLYGADVVYRDFSIEQSDPHVKVYSLKSDKNKCNLNRNKLVALALLLGCDYSKGVPGIGKETVIKLLSEINCDDILERFKDWKNLSESELFPGLENQPLKKDAHCNRCGHLGSCTTHKKGGCSACNSEITCYLPDTANPCKCPWHVNEELKHKWKTELKIYNLAMECAEFPDLKVVDEYLNFNDTIPSDDALDWTCPKMCDFQDKTLNLFSWTHEYSFEKFLPLMTSWQQYKLRASHCDKINFIYEPVKILKERRKRDNTYFEVQWRSVGKDSKILDENLVTSEFGDRFAVSYKGFVDDFYCQLEEQKEAKKKSKKLKSDKGSQKIDDFLVRKTCKRDIDTSVKEDMKFIDPNMQSAELKSESGEPNPKEICI